MPRLRTYYGRDGSPYLTRVEATARLKLNVFHRGDQDPDPHDHPWDFWTFPLTSYYEEYYPPTGGPPRVRLVRAWRWHYRPAEHRHRVLGRARGGAAAPGRVYTLMRAGAVRRQWGFWVPDLYGRLGRRMVPWRDYVA